ncbi:cytochrome oxidase putative small subunit CydP [Methylomonas sp. MgM2]
MTIDKPTLPKPGLLRREICFALFIKLILLIGLWFLIFRWQEQPAVKPDMAKHFALSPSQSSSRSDFSTQP